MKSKLIIIATLLVVTGADSWAQPKLNIANDLKNIGEVIFQQPRRVTFELTNTGTAPLQLQRVGSSCGCTTVEWPKEGIAPGESATLTATFDAKMLGSFHKEIELWTNADADPVYLTIQGRVVAATTDYEGTFPIDMGVARLSTNVVEFDDVNRGDHPEAVIMVMNNSRTSYRPELMHLPSYLSATYHPELLAGGRVGRIVLHLDSERLKNYGLTETSVYLARKLGDKVSAENEIDVSAILLPGFANLSPDDLAKAPHMELERDSLVFTLAKDKESQVVMVSNSGQRPLNVRSVQVHGKGVNVKLGNRVIKPGKSVQLKVTVIKDMIHNNKSTPRILLITDDPARPKTIVKIKTMS